jgi:hypothetical protein
MGTLDASWDEEFGSRTLWRYEVCSVNQIAGIFGTGFFDGRIG